MAAVAGLFICSLFLSLLTHHVCLDDKMLSEKHLKIATVTMSPYMELSYDSAGNIAGARGMVFQIVEWLSKRLNFTYTFVEPPDRTFGLLVNNTWTGMIKMVHEHEVDLAAGPFTPTAERAEVVHFNYCFAQDPLGVLIPAPSEGSQLAAIAKPFQTEVWILLILAMVCISLMTWLAMKFSFLHLPSYENISPGDRSYKQHFLFTLRILCCQAQSFTTNTSHSTRVAAASWCLTSVIFVYLYSGSLTSFMAVPKRYPVVNSMEELSKSAEIQLMVFSGTFFQGFLQDSEYGKYKLLGDSLRKNPANKIKLSDTDKAIQRVLTGKYALLFEKSFLESIVETDLKQTGKCRMALMREEFFTARECFVMPKDSPFIKLIDNGIQMMQSSGLLDHWHSVYWTPPNRCTVVRQEQPRTPILSLSNLAGAFILFVSGLFISALTYVIELISSAYKKQKNKNY